MTAIRLHRLLWILPLLLAVRGPAIGAEVYVQDSPAALELLEEVKERLGRQEPEQAARLLQKVLDEHAHKLLALEPDLYVESQRAAWKLLLSEPDLLASYRLLHGPGANRLLEMAADDPEALAQLLNRYALTPAGLEAGLRLAGLGLEAAQPEAATVILAQLSDHPDLGPRRTTWLGLRAAAAAWMGQTKALAEFRGQLEAAGATEELLQADSLVRSLEKMGAAPARSFLDPFPGPGPSEIPLKPLWTQTVGGAERYLMEAYATDRQQLDLAARDGDFLNTGLLLDSTALYVNDGQTLHAIEPNSGRVLWRHHAVDPGAPVGPLGRYYGRNLYGLDMNLLAGSGHRLVGIYGFSAMVAPFSYGWQAADSLLSCVESRGGQPIWHLTPGQVHPSLVGGFWYGRPIVSEGRVYASLRLRQRTQFQDAYVVAVDLRGGRPIWVRHLASAGLAERRSMPGLAHMLLDDGRLFVDTRLGTVARLSAADGSVQWLRIQPLNEQAGDMDPPRPWQSSESVLTEAGLTVLDDWGATVRVYDPETGQVLKTIPAGEWSNPNYLVRAGRDLLVVGRDSVALRDGNSLAERWTWPGQGRILGRVALTGDRIYVPAGSALHMLDFQTGKHLGALAVETPLHVLVHEGRLISAGRRQVHFYGTFADSSTALMEAAALAPDDLRPLMGRAWLAFASGRGPELLQSLDQAVEKAVGAGEAEKESRGELFNLILSMLRSTEPQDESLRGDLFQRLAIVPTDGDQEVTYRLELARFHEAGGRLEEALGQYNAILQEPEFRRRLFSHEGGSRQAGLEARRRLEAILEKHGPALYEPYQVFARRRLQELSQQADPAPLLELAEAYPAAETVGQALFLAAQATAGRGMLDQAVELLERSAHQTREPKVLGLVHGRQAELLEQAGLHQRALRVLRTFQRVHPKTSLTRGGREVVAEDWIQRLVATPAARRSGNHLTPPLISPGMILEGALLLPQGRDLDKGLPNGFLLQTKSAIQMRRTDDGSLAWSRPLEGKPDVIPARLIWADPSAIWLWHDGWRLECLDAATGRVIWQENELDRRLAAMRAGEADRPRNPQEAQVQRILPMGPMILRQPGREAPDPVLKSLVAVRENCIVLADELGRMVVLDAGTGKVKWQVSTLVREASLLETDGRHVVIGGTDEDDSPLVCVHDAATGVLLYRLAKIKRNPILWAGFSEGGLLVCVSEDQVEAFDLHRSEPRWVSTSPMRLSGAGATWMSPQHLLAAGPDDDLVWMDLDDGHLAGRLPTRTVLGGTLQVAYDGVNWLASGQERSAALSSNGQIFWADGLADVMALVGQVLTERHLVVLRGPGAGVNEENQTWRVMILEREGGKIAFQHTFQSAEPMDRMTILDGKILVGGPAHTIVIPGQKAE